MIIQFFKSNNAAAFIFLPLISIAFWAFGYMDLSVVYDKHSMPLYELLAFPLTEYAWLGTTLALALVISGALLLNHIVNENEVLAKQSFLPALFYIVFMSNNNAMLKLNPLLFANIFLLFGINKLLSSYRKNIAFSESFDAGFLFSIASLFYFPYCVFFPLLGVALIILRPFNWREWIISFIGVLVPYIFVFSIYFLLNQLDYLIHDKILFTFFKNDHTLTNHHESFYMMMGIGWTIMLLSLMSLFSAFGGGSQRAKKGVIVMIWIFLFSVLVAFIAPAVSTIYFSAMAIPASVFCANYFLKIKKTLIAEFLFFILAGSVFIHLILYFF